MELFQLSIICYGLIIISYCKKYTLIHVLVFALVMCKVLTTFRILPDENVVEALAIDYLGRNMYIMDGMRQLLLACSLKDFVCTTVLTNTTSSPRSLQLDLRNR